MGSSAFHGLIHTGYGLSESSQELVCEGLAYLHHSYAPLVVSTARECGTFGTGDLDLVEVLDMVRGDAEMREFMLAESLKDWVKERQLGEFQNRLLALVTGRGDELMKYVDRVAIPEQARESGGESTTTASMGRI